MLREGRAWKRKKRMLQGVGLVGRRREAIDALASHRH
jgi:hypothetical protein